MYRTNSINCNKLTRIYSKVLLVSPQNSFVMAAPISVISSQYCLPYSINLKIDTKKDVTYVDNNVVFIVKESSFSLHDRRVLYDVSEKPIFTLYKKNMTMHDRCRVFKGKSKDPTELLFSVKRSSMIQLGKINLNVFLANNIDESACDFKVKVSSLKKSCDIYAGESSRIVATMQNKGAFEVFVHPHIDYAFIVALLLILDEMEHFDFFSDLAIETTIGVPPNLIAGMLS